MIKDLQVMDAVRGVTFSISPYKSIISKDEALKILDNEDSALYVSEMIDLAVRGGCIELDDGRKLYASKK